MSWELEVVGLRRTAGVSPPAGERLARAERSPDCRTALNPTSQKPEPQLGLIVNSALTKQS